MVTLVVKDSSGEILCEEKMEGGMNFVDELAEREIEIPFSCRAGACMSCAAQVTKGLEFINQEADGKKYIETDDDTVLTCIAGPTDEAVKSEKECVIEFTLLM